MNFKELADLTAEILSIDPEKLRTKENLIDQGLDSMRMISLIEALRQKGYEVDFFAISALTTLEEWADELKITH